LLLTYSCEAGFSPTRTAARPGRMPCAWSLAISGFQFGEDFVAIFRPSRLRAGMGIRFPCVFEVQMIAREEKQRSNEPTRQRRNESVGPGLQRVPSDIRAVMVCACVGARLMEWSPTLQVSTQTKWRTRRGQGRTWLLLFSDQGFQMTVSREFFLGHEYAAARRGIFDFNRGKRVAVIRSVSAERTTSPCWCRSR